MLAARLRVLFWRRHDSGDITIVQDAKSSVSLDLDEERITRENDISGVPISVAPWRGAATGDAAQRRDPLCLPGSGCRASIAAVGHLMTHFAAWRCGAAAAAVHGAGT